MKPFVQADSQRSTLQHWKQILTGNKLSSLAAFAYVTDSGVAQINTHLRGLFGRSRDSRWLFSFDYGRSHPTALRTLKRIANSTIRIHDGAYVAQSAAFTPRVSFHLKTALTLQDNGYPCHQIVGSGNLSASGLISGIEAGCVVDYSDVCPKSGASLIAALEGMWERATPLERVLDDYSRRYKEIVQPGVSRLDDVTPDANTLFWIDIGYVTKNRGPDRPGNQFDLPKGSHSYLGINKVRKPARNSVLGSLRLKTPTGAIVERRLRFGNNAMEKLTLPIPEDYGYQSYDGKILTFRRDGGLVALECLEHDDFFRIYGRSISSCDEMKSGRQYGTVALRQALKPRPAARRSETAV